MSDWLPGALVLNATEDGGPQITSYPAKLVLHTTEGGGTVQDLAAYYHTSTYWPHFTADLARKQLAQHIPYSRGGRALSHPSGHVATNDAHCIQIEIIGHAADSATWPDDEIVWLGKTLAPMMNQLGIKRQAPKFVAYPASAGFYFIGRFSETYWAEFPGVCGHEHVPENDHGDPGAFKISLFLASTLPQGGPVPPTVPPEFNPAHPTRAEVSDVDCPTGGAWGVTADGAVQTHGSAPFHGGPFGDSRVQKPFQASLIELPNTAEAAAGMHYTVVSAANHRYAY